MEAVKSPPQSGQEDSGAYRRADPWYLLILALGHRQYRGVKSVGFEFTQT